MVLILILLLTVISFALRLASMSINASRRISNRLNKINVKVTGKNTKLTEGVHKVTNVVSRAASSALRTACLILNTIRNLLTAILPSIIIVDLIVLAIFAAVGSSTLLLYDHGLLGTSSAVVQQQQSGGLRPGQVVTPPSGEPVENFSTSRLIIVGDSRTVGMKSCVTSDATFIAEVSKGLQWLKDTAITQIESSIKDDSIIVFNLGVNDLGNASNYVTYLNEFKQNHPGVLVYFMSVNPVDEAEEREHGYLVTNSSIETFNSTLKSGLVNIGYIDTYTYLKGIGFETADGLHYNSGTYKNIYDCMVNYLEGN